VEELARQGKFVINWAGVNVTGDIARFLKEVTYVDHEEAASDEATIVLDNSEGLWSGDWYPTCGDTLELYIGYTDALVWAGLFEIDEVVMKGTPHEVEVKCIAAYMTKALRTKNNKAFEAQTLKQIAQYFCTKHSFTLVDDTSNMLSQINLERKTQEDKTDLQFLTELATEYGFIFSVRGKKMVFTDYYTLDNADSKKSLSIYQICNYSITDKTYDTYASAKFIGRNSRENKLTTQYMTWGDELVTENILSLKGDASTHNMAERKLKAGIWNKNRFKQAGTLNDIPGDPSLVSGINIDLTGLLNASGKYHITTSSHTISGEGAYTTSLEIRKTGTIPKPERVPPKKDEKETFDTDVDDYLQNTETEEETE
jgi:phage protein D